MTIVRGIYSAASGMLVESTRMDVTSNNLANVDTAGFQKQVAHIYSFPDTPISRVYQGQRQVIGRLGTGALVEGSYTSFAPGSLKTTENPLDMAIVGEGFFTIETSEGPRYTRDGRFTIDPTGYLTTLDGNLVRGESGRIYVGEAEEVLLNEEGDIFIDGEVVDKLLLVQFADAQGLARRGANLYEALPEAGNATISEAKLAPGVIEMANVNVVREMVDLIKIQRAYEANQKVVQAYDETLGKLNDL